MIELIDTVRPVSNKGYPIVLSNDIKGGLHSVDTLEERDLISTERLQNGMLCYVKNDGFYQYKDEEWDKFSQGSIVVETKNDLLSLDKNKYPLGILCYVKDDIDEIYIYYLSINGWKKISSKVGCYIGRDEPEDKSLVWFNPYDEEVESLLPQDKTLQDFQNTVNNLFKKFNELEKRVDNLNGGSFVEDGTTSSETTGGNYTTFKIKHGLSTNLRQLKEGELVYCTDTNALYIGVRLNPAQSIVTNVKIVTGNGGDSDTPIIDTEVKYLELITNNGTKYRLMVSDDGSLVCRESSYYEADDPLPSASVNFKGLIINRVYGGGAVGADIAPISHGFIELYNNNPNGLTMNLKGLSLHYKTKSDSVWKKLELEGYIPYQHSFLIRCARHTSDYSGNCRYKITNYDMDWSSLAISDEGFMVYLSVGRDVVTVVNPFNANDTGLKAEGYIDLIALGGENQVDSCNAYEGSSGFYPNFGNKFTGAQRRDFEDSDNNYKDIEPVNYRTCDVNVYRPRCLKDGAWSKYYNKIKLNERIPNMINITYGVDERTRVFTWQSVVTDSGYVRYRVVGELDWVYEESTREMVRHADCDATIHRCIVRNIPIGTIEYQCGEEGAWSDSNKLIIKHHDVTDETDHIKFINTSDQQGDYEKHYDAWKWAGKYIQEHENIDDMEFHLHTGDMTQTPLDAFQFRYFYKHAWMTRTMCSMNTVGNNDIVDDIYSYTFKYVNTYENEQHIESTSGFPVMGAYSFDVGFVHFVNVNSNVNEDSDLIVKQMNWAKTDVENARARSNPPRWVVLVTHASAFMVDRMKSTQQFIPFVEDIGFDLVICGHRHSYSRSQPILMNIKDEVETTLECSIYDAKGNALTNAVYGIGFLSKTLTDCNEGQNTIEGNNQSASLYVNEKQGIYWVMCHTTGQKLKSNKVLEMSDPTPWWYGWIGEHPYAPAYIMWDFGWNEIKLRSQAINGVMVYDEKLKNYVVSDNITLDSMTGVVLDEFTITHKSLR